MEPCPGIAPVTRALLAVERAQRTSAFEIATRSMHLRLSLRAGRIDLARLAWMPRVASGWGAERPLEYSLHVRGSLGGRVPEGRTKCGQAGQTTRPGRGGGAFGEVCAIDGLAAAFGAAPIEPRVHPEPSDRGVPIGRALVRALVRAHRGVSLDELLEPLKRAPLHATPTARRLGGSVVADPSAREVMALVVGGATLTSLSVALDASEPRLRTLAALYQLGFVERRRPDRASYSLLLRKRNQIRKEAGPHALLDIPLGAPPRQARRALWRLAGKLHPDRFGPNAPSFLVHASGEVMGALIRAEAQLR